MDETICIHVLNVIQTYQQLSRASFSHPKLTCGSFMILSYRIYQRCQADNTQSPYR